MRDTELVYPRSRCASCTPTVLGSFRHMRCSTTSPGSDSIQEWLEGNLVRGWVTVWGMFCGALDWMGLGGAKEAGRSWDEKSDEF